METTTAVGIGRTVCGFALVFRLMRIKKECTCLTVETLPIVEAEFV